MKNNSVTFIEEIYLLEKFIEAEEFQLVALPSGQGCEVVDEVSLFRAGREGVFIPTNCTGSKYIYISLNIL